MMANVKDLVESEDIPPENTTPLENGRRITFCPNILENGPM